MAHSMLIHTRHIFHVMQSGQFQQLVSYISLQQNKLRLEGQPPVAKSLPTLP